MKLARELHGEAGGRGDGRDDWHARHNGLLHDFKSAAPADEQYRFRKWYAAFEQRPADYFIYRVVPADIFAQDQQFSIWVEEGGGVEASSALEDVLRFAQRVGQGYEQFRVEAKIRIGGCQQARADGINRRFSADAAAGGGEEVAFHFCEVWGGFGCEFRFDYVAAVRAVLRLGGF